MCSSDLREQIFSLPAACLLYPAHDYRGLTVTSVAEERAHNPRLGGDVSVDDFAGYMHNLGLPHPKQMDVAVPANLQCGRPEAGLPEMHEPQWAPLTFTFGGIWEIQPHTLEELGERVEIIDVREAAEFEGALGHIAGARLIPLGELAARAGEISRDKPVVAVCRSGARHAARAPGAGETSGHTAGAGAGPNRRPGPAGHGGHAAPPPANQAAWPPARWRAAGRCCRGRH